MFPQLCALGNLGSDTLGEGLLIQAVPWRIGAGLGEFRIIMVVCTVVA